MNKIIFLWTHPRSLSSAFYRTVYERGDMDTIFEPFVHVHYKNVFKKNKDCRIAYSSKKFHTRYRDIKNSIEKRALENHVFIKDMAFCAADYIDDELIKKSINVFLIRDPEKSLPSFYNVLKQNKYFPDSLIKLFPFSFLKSYLLKPAGYRKLYSLYNRCCRFQNPLVIDSCDFERNPGKVMEAFCDHCDLPNIRLHGWERGEIDDFKFAGTKMFHENISKSSGVCPQNSIYKHTVKNNKLLKKFYKHSIFYYNFFCMKKTTII